jgi:uncharacterized damage-inducible protein DinB
MPQPAARLVDLRDVLLETYAVNDVMNQLLLEHLDPRAWRAQLPTAKSLGLINKDSKARGSNRGVRTIAAIFVHMHNCRLRWLKRSAPHLKRPAPLDPYRCTQKQAAAAHKKSAAQCLRMLTDALSDNPNRRVTKFWRDSWFRVWPAGAAMWAYMYSHEAHHRGQILLLAHQLGYRVPTYASYRMWHWDWLWKQAGLATRPR